MTCTFCRYLAQGIPGPHDPTGIEDALAFRRVAVKRKTSVNGQIVI
jgi:hypothetical protein